MGLYIRQDASNLASTAVLIHPSVQLWYRIKEEINAAPSEDRNIWGHWTRLPLLIFTGLASGWADYVTFLHDRSSTIVSLPHCERLF